ncbi:membrane protein [Pseudonocardia yunnanensis]|uniref:Glycosyltransferase RgtA/B/C/D-like domain-containing protein n=1 Tax=Pseudonocardia yunnanensis TaxID=58107 RepID=A0ABW4F264_9PSEU
MAVARGAGSAAISIDVARARRVLDALAPAVVYLLVRLAGVGVLAAMAAHDGASLLGALTSWDGHWLLAIAEHGYAAVPADMVDATGHRTPETPLGFFPGYPGLVAAARLLTGGNLVAAGLLVSTVAGVAAAFGLTRLGESVPGGSRRAGLLLTCLFAASPMAVALSMTYTEALFCALAVWALVGVLREQWMLAGLCAAGAGLVRPTGSSVVAAVGLAALAAVIQRRGGWRPWVAGALAATGALGYVGYVAVRTGVLGGWFVIQREGWGWHLDGGVATVRWLAEVLTSSQNVFDLLTVLSLVGSVVLFVVAVVMRMPWPLLVYGGLVLVTTWGTDGLMNSKLRVLLPAFVLLLPVAIGLAGRRRATAVAVVVAAAFASAWFGAYALTIWPYAI